MDVSSSLISTVLISGSTAQGSGRVAGASANAWRYQWEQQAGSALQAFRAVNAGNAALAPQAGMAQTETAPVFAPPLNGSSDSPQAALTNRAPTPLAPLASAATLAPMQAVRAYAALAFESQTADARTPALKLYSSEQNGPRQTSAILRFCLASGDAQWPWRKLHLVLEDGGVRAWLRDSGMVEGGAELTAMLHHLQQALAGIGLRLFGFTLNGKPLALA